MPGLQMACDAQVDAWLHAAIQDYIPMAAISTADESLRPAVAAAPGESEIVNPFALAAGMEPQQQWPAKTVTVAEVPAGETGHQVA